jgi:hypothetical protein
MEETQFYYTGRIVDNFCHIKTDIFYTLILYVSGKGQFQLQLLVLSEFLSTTEKQ